MAKQIYTTPTSKFIEINAGDIMAIITISEEKDRTSSFDTEEYLGSWSDIWSLCE